MAALELCLNVGAGSIVALGGAMGYIKQRSLPSLLAGGLSGTMLVVSGLNEQPRLGASVSLLLLGMMLPKAIKTGKAISMVVSFLAMLTFLVNARRMAR
eukprot:CAMPEP_0206469538 /NCGR_PEP_ID=MMETSP0324_2-20121206/30345_1 /ASSEMBLY_ACC=CAM_ASM_000836 /TAXON_ID=2866 /ORGANISM="Crypthecodinium cohnii, Strain Seligo" /LENGTH=98 /DNA_ID=CAMNT_0053943327 /DNA_START=51 /DNA_END=347 /DNA_ORIENTATION=+